MEWDPSVSEGSVSKQFLYDNSETFGKMFCGFNTLSILSSSALYEWLSNYRFLIRASCLIV